jgi:hypothetical protein
LIAVVIMRRRKTIVTFIPTWLQCLFLIFLRVSLAALSSLGLSPIDRVIYLQQRGAHYSIICRKRVRIHSLSRHVGYASSARPRAGSRDNIQIVVNIMQVHGDRSV